MKGVEAMEGDNGKGRPAGHEPVKTGDGPDTLESLRHPAYFGPAETPARDAQAEAPPVAGAGAARPQADAPASPAAPAEARRKSALLTFLIAVAVALIIGMAGASFFTAGATRTAERMPATFAVDVGEVPPNFRGYLLDPQGPGPLFTRNDTLGRPLVLVAWSADDARVKPILRGVSNLALSERFNEGEVTFLGLYIGRDRQPAVGLLRETDAYTWPHLYNTDPRLGPGERPAVRMNISHTPAIYVFGSVGRLRAKGVTLEDLPEALYRAGAR